MFLANTVNVAFSPVLLREVEAAQDSSINKSSKFQPTQSSNGFCSHCEDKNKRTPAAFNNFWELNKFDKNTRLDGTKDCSDFAIADEDSIELVIGVNNAKPEAYASVVEAISGSQGKIVSAISIRGEVIAVVADFPLNVISSLKEEVQSSSLVRYTEPNMKFQALFVPNDPYWSIQWGPQKIEADWAWNTTMGDPSVLVAVIDTGIDYDHPDLDANYIALGYDWVNDDFYPMDDHGHGTHCAGIIAAVLNNGIGIAGLAQVKIMAEKALNSSGWGTEADLANAIIDAVDQGADILSNSWGGPRSELIYDAIKYAHDKGVLVVAAAGNAASRTKHYPAAYDEVVAVTATDQYDDPASFTSFGDWVEVAAPGVYIHSTVWDDSYTLMSGTSMACPHAVGVATLIWSQFPNATRDWVRAQLRYTADDLGDPGFDEYYGYGRINAKNAVEQEPPDHDLLIFDWQRPSYIEPGDSVAFNVTVLNFGSNDESDVTVNLLVDGNVTDSKSIGILANGTLSRVSLLWNAISEGIYNVTVWVEPVLGESDTTNNVASVEIKVRFIEVALFKNADPWGYPANEEVLSLYDVPYAVFDSYDFGRVNITSFSKVIIASDQDQDFYDAMDAYRGWFEDYVSGGGMLEIHAADSGWNEGEWIGTLPGGLIWNSYYSNYVTIINPAHPVVNIPNPITDTELDSWNGSVHGYFTLYPPNSSIVIREDSSGYPAYLEFNYGNGVIVASSQTLEWAYRWKYSLILENSLLYFAVKYPHELAVTLEAPVFLEPDNSALLQATVYNIGLNNETNVALQLLIDGSIVDSVEIPEFQNSSSYMLSYNWTPTAEATYNVTAYVPPVPDEQLTFNNKITWFVSVAYPLIRPIEGQWTNYTINYYDDTGRMIGTGYWNLTYDHYVEPYLIYITLQSKDPSGYIETDWMIVNIMNRWVESGVWAGLWYPGWIETNITIGSTINLLDSTATVNGTRIVLVGSRAIDCWEIPYSMYAYPYTFWYDKASGLWIRMETVDPYSMNRIELLLADTNVPVGTQYEHDLGVTLDAPLRLQPGETSILQATVYNIGLNNESYVEIQILINGTEVTSETLTNLANGTWYTINYSWTPTAEETYNITAYTPPVPDENVTINNIVSKMVHVRYVEVALISDHSELLAIAPILDSMGIGYDIYNDNSMYLYTENLSLLLNYKAVIFYTDYRWITLNEYSALEAYLSLGGSLLVTGFDCLVSDTNLASLVRSSSTGDNTGEYDLIVINDAHPIMDGPYGSFPAGYHIYGLSSDCDMAEADTARNAVTVAELADGYDKIIATDGLPGKVVFWNGVGTNDWTWNSDCQTMFKNLIQWFTVRYQHELVVSLQAPTFLEPGDSTMLNATVQNAGLNDEADINLQILINSTLVENVTIPLLANGTLQTVSHLWTPAIAGKYNLTVYAPPVSGENITRNNIYSKLLPVQYAPRILAYVEYTYRQEYANTLRAIKSTFGPNYYLTELSDYTQLDSMLLGKDILLIPEQQNADRYTLENIGRAWSTTLSEFLENGGIIIVCDFNWGSGGTYGILTGAGLMSISGANYRTWYSLYLVDHTDPLAEGVSSFFTAPDGTISFVTGEANVVVNDGTYPAVIHKEIGRGHIALLGFDFYSSNNNTAKILGNAVALASYITLSINSSGGSSGTEVTVSGTKATANGTVSIYWDGMFVANTTADNVGDFTYLLTVPSNATIGIHEIMALDVTTGRTASRPFRVLIITLNPSIGPVGTKVTVKGAGFTPESQATITFNDMLIGYALVDNIGNFTFTFNIPVSTAETQLIKAYNTEGYGSATFTVKDITRLDVQIDVGEMHFRGEIAEFYAQTTFKGKAVNATITSAVLYKPDGATENVLAQSITTGLYKLSYTIPADASTGTYTLVIAAEYVTDTIQASGTSFKCFLISPTLTYTNAYVVEIRENIATVVIPNLGAIKLNLTAMNVTLDNIFLKVIAINGTTATIQTTIGVMNGTLTGTLSGDIATIVIPGLGQIETDVSSLKGTQEAWTIPQYLILAFALIAAANATISVILLRFRKTIETR